MTPTGNHPRFPYGMARDVQLVIADEVAITLGGYPERRTHASLEHAITAYAELLEPFIPIDIREGFRLARAQATQLAPTPSQVRLCVAAAYRDRQSLPDEASDDEPLGEFPEELRQFYRGKLDAPPAHAGVEGD